MTAGNTNGSREYLRRRLELGDTLRAALHIARQRADAQAEHRARRRLARLAGDRFRPAAVGQFSRGKRTLMNALLGALYPAHRDGACDVGGQVRSATAVGRGRGTAVAARTRPSPGRADMRGFALKREALSGDLATREESPVYDEVLRLLAGHSALARVLSARHVGETLA